MNEQLERGFYIAHNRRYSTPEHGPAVLSREYDGHGHTLLAFKTPADAEEYLVSWGATQDCEVLPRLFKEPADIRSLAQAVLDAGVHSMAINPPLDDRHELEAMPLQSVEEWAQERLDT